MAAAIHPPPGGCRRRDILATLDYEEDYDLIRRAYEELGARDPLFGVASLIAWVRAHPALHASCLRVRGIGRR